MPNQYQTHSVQSIIDAKQQHYNREELFAGPNGTLNLAASKPFYCGACRQAEVRAVPATPQRRAYIALIDASRSDHREDCEYDFTKQARTIYSGTTYTHTKDGNYILDLFGSAEDLTKHLESQLGPVEVQEDYRHRTRSQATQTRTLNKYLRTVIDILKLLQDFDNSPEITQKFQARNSANGELYKWQDIYYDLRLKKRVAALKQFLIRCHDRRASVPPLIIVGVVKAKWTGSKYPLTTSFLEKEVGLQALIRPPYKGQTPFALEQGQTIVAYGRWVLSKAPNTSRPVKLNTGANRVSFSWSNESQLAVMPDF